MTDEAGDAADGKAVSGMRLDPLDAARGGKSAELGCQGHVRGCGRRDDTPDMHGIQDGHEAAGVVAVEMRADHGIEPVNAHCTKIGDNHACTGRPGARAAPAIHKRRGAVRGMKDKRIAQADVEDGDTERRAGIMPHHHKAEKDHAAYRGG